jgi:hypothetical protein
MEAMAVAVGSSTASSSMATALTLSSQCMGDDRVGSIGTTRKMGDAMRLARMGSKVSHAEVEVKAQSEPMKDGPPVFPLLDLYDFICRWEVGWVGLDSPLQLMINFRF